MSGTPALVQVPGLAAVAGVDHRFETRAGRLADALPEPIVRLRQVHGDRVHRLHADTDLTPYLHEELDRRPAGDAIVSDRTNVTIAIATADCVPVLLASASGAIGAAHAGWRGLTADVIGATVGVLAAAFGASPQALVAAIGPCAGREAYEVSGEVHSAFLAAGLPAALFEPTRPGHWLCDLAAAAEFRLRAAGVDRIEHVDRCTVRESDIFHSWRRDGAAAGRMLSGIALRP